VFLCWGFQIMTLRTCLQKQAGVDKFSACAGINAAPLFVITVSTEGGGSGFPARIAAFMAQFSIKVIMREAISISEQTDRQIVLAPEGEGK